MNPYFIAGLIEGEGYFGVNITKNDSLNVGHQVCLSFGIDMDIRELDLIKEVKSTLECGTIHIRKDNSKVQLRVRKLSDIVDKIIPFFDRYELYGGKKKDFEIFKIIALLMQENRHLTSDGLDDILDIRKSLHIYSTI